ncbi:MAG: hypothetical protein JWN03_1541 [Nocardia sp.]|nr:hypothetical protein [Nocardia sp.]
MEIVQVESLDRARGTQIGLVYELRWELDGSELIVDIGDGAVHHRLDGADFFDLQHSVFFNSLPVLRHGLLLPDAAPHDYTMRYVSVPQLTARLAAQRYLPRGEGVVGYSSDDFSADIEFDQDGFATVYENYMRRLHP